MSIGLVMTYDGRSHCIRQTLKSLQAHVLTDNFTYLRIVDDSGQPNLLPTDWVEGYDIIKHPQRSGLAAAVNSAWANLPDDIDYVFHCEDDWIFPDRIPVEAMRRTLQWHPHLAQLVLKRQPGNPEEAAAGGIIECHPDQYADKDGYVEHARIFSLNPCLIPRHIVDRGWPDHGHEGIFTDQLVADGYRFAFWGERHDPPRVDHIGHQRSSGWVL
jgi:glycosyltransferase involved in cell wall biosynthesis